MGNFIGKITQKGGGSKETVVKQEILKNASLLNVNVIGDQTTSAPFFSSVKNIVKGFSSAVSLLAYGYNWGRLDSQEELKRLKDELRKKEEMLGEVEKLEEGGAEEEGDGGEKLYKMDPPFV